MPIKITDIYNSGQSDTITIDFGDAGSLNLTVNPNRFTLGTQRQMQQGVKDEDVVMVAEAFFKVVTDWDLEDDDGEKLPLDAESIDRIGLNLFMDITSKMGDVIAPKPEAGTSSPPTTKTPSSRKRK